MKVKCSFIYEIKDYETYQDAKSQSTKKKSRKQFEEDFVKEIGEILIPFFDDNESITEIKAKIIERKDET